MISTFMGFLIEDMEPINIIQLKVGELYYIEDTLSCIQNMAKYLGVVELFKLHKKMYEGDYDKFYKEYAKDRFLFDMGIKDKHFRYAIVKPQLKTDGNNIIINLKVEKYSNNFTTAPMDDVPELEYRLKEENV